MGNEDKQGQGPAVCLKFDQSTLEQLDAWVAAESTGRPFGRFHRTDAVRAAVRVGLAVLRGERPTGIELPANVSFEAPADQTAARPRATRAR
jgi:hypothetical protein